MKNAVLIEAENLGMLCQGGAAGDTPSRSKAVFVRKFAQATLQGVTQNIAHALHAEDLERWMQR